MKDSYDLNSNIGRPEIQETGLPKSYSKRKFVASFKADPELWSRFKETCAARGVSICHVMEALMESWIQGQKAEATLVRPVIVNLNMQHIVRRPRRLKNLEDVMYEARRKNWPPPCEKADDFIRSKKEVGCLEIRDWIPLAKCWRCFMLGDRGAGSVERKSWGVTRETRVVLFLRGCLFLRRPGRREEFAEGLGVGVRLNLFLVFSHYFYSPLYAGEAGGFRYFLIQASWYLRIAASLSTMISLMRFSSSSSVSRSLR